MKQLFIAWVPFQRRSVSLQDHFDYQLEFVTISFKNRLLRPLEYLLKTTKTLSLFLWHRPQVIWLQLPPTIMLYLSYLYQQLLKRDAIIIADCHNATFRAPWIKFPHVIALLNRCDLVLVHSEQVEHQAKDIGIDSQRVCLLEDPPTVIAKAAEQGADPYPHPWVICPCSFNRDEPINELLEAARLAPEITFVITGKTSRAKGIHDLSNVPENVVLAGFLPLETFNSLLLHTDVVLGLTKLDGIQLSVAVEATGTGTPMVLSNTPLLKKLFYKGAVYVDSAVPSAIAKGTQQALANHQTLAQSVNELKDERKIEWLTQAEKVNALFSSTKPFRQSLP